MPNREPDVSQYDTFAARLAQGRRILGVREWRDVNQADLARRVEVHATAVSRWEAGVRRPEPDLVRRIAGVLGCAPGWLMFGEGDPPSLEGATVPPAAAPPADLPSSREAIAPRHRRRRA